MSIMKDYLKSQIKNIPMTLLLFVLFYGITALATNYIFRSDEVSYDNTDSGLHADEVQGAINEVFQHATDYSEIKTTIGDNPLTTTSKTLIGGINEINGQVVTLTSISTGTIAKGSIITDGTLVDATCRKVGRVLTWRSR